MPVLNIAVFTHNRLKRFASYDELVMHCGNKFTATLLFDIGIETFKILMLMCHFLMHLLVVLL